MTTIAYAATRELPTAVKEIATAPIRTLADAQRFIDVLHANNCVFHFEDSPFDIIDSATNERLFPNAYASCLQCRVDELYEQAWPVEYGCPIGYALELCNHQMSA